MNSRKTDLQTLLAGYARIMLIWALLRALMSIFDVINLIRGGVQAGFITILMVFLVILILALYLGFTGYFGQKSLSDSSKLKIFKIMSIIGASISGALLVLYVYWRISGLASTQADVFCTTIDFMLYAVGVYYAWRIERDLN